MEFAVDRRCGARERRQEVACFRGWFSVGTAADFAVNLCVLVKAVSIVSCSLKEC